MEKVIATGILAGGNVIVSNQEEANAIYSKGYFGEMLKGGKLNLALVEALFLVNREKLKVFEGKKELTFDDLLKKAKKEDKTIFGQYVAYSDLRDRGYIAKTGYKFGAHFRIYKRGDQPGQAHSAFLVHTIPEYYPMTMTDVSRFVRLGHSVKKRMWLAVADAEGDLTYYEVRRIKP
ncbi:TPA: tRNA-intron lyase [archaeon]|uniref:tRNA-intron lyase n=1 Tax=Candidatus Naiadarchaeum limnaeum TaxID=2756139 RepID=A0A832UQS8_9ARCH|nr:tRNA-intron lyase [Candidatus Naiadarchaeum limnaeum]